MRRRSFLGLTGAAVPVSLTAWQDRSPSNGRMTIDRLEIIRVDGHREAETGVNHQFQVNPLHIYDELRPKPYHDGVPGTRRQETSALYLSLRTTAGLDALYGPVDKEAAIVVDQQLKGFLKGRDALAGELLWDLMYRSNRHSRSGLFLMAISAVDNALWDLRARYFNVPVYRLLGGPTRSAVEAYGSCLGYSVEPNAVRARSTNLRDQGFRRQKWFMAYGPGDGPEGLSKNVELARVLRESLGDGVELMFDAYSGWYLDYAVAWAKQAERYNPRWIEEAFHPEKIDSFVQLRRSTSIPVAAGEHLYGRWEVHDYLKAGAISVVQADPEWCGGISELVKICSVASLFDAQVIPHGHSVHAALHVVASQSPMTCPLIEYLILKMASYYHFERNGLAVVNGAITLPDRPGFGIELDPSKVERRTTMVWS